MKIAMMVRSYLETPVPNDIAYSPATIAQPIAEGLAKKGHAVTFFGPKGTKLNQVTIETCGIRPFAKTDAEFEDKVSTTDLFQNYRFSLYDLRMAKEMLTRAAEGEFDCVVFNHFESVLPLAALFPTVPIIYIMHDYMEEERRQAIDMYASPNQHFISISNSQRTNAPDLPYYTTVYNGINIDHFTFEDQAEDYLFCAGRITPDKGIKEAVQVAIAANRRLLIAGSLSKADSWYFDAHIKPFLNDKILFLGRLDKEQLVKYYQKAAAFLMPVQWPEPFGLTMAEAGACGTPVIAFRRGATQEVVVDGKTGFIVDNSAEMIMAIEKIPTIRRRDCRIHIESNFTHAIMVNGYEAAIKGIIDKSNDRVVQRRKRRKNFSTELSRLSKLIAGDSNAKRR